VVASGEAMGLGAVKSPVTVAAACCMSIATTTMQRIHLMSACWVLQICTCKCEKKFYRKKSKHHGIELLGRLLEIIREFSSTSGSLQKIHKMSHSSHWMQGE
jgi:hypothetical protein